MSDIKKVFVLLSSRRNACVCGETRSCDTCIRCTLLFRSLQACATVGLRDSSAMLAQVASPCGSSATRHASKAPAAARYGVQQQLGRAALLGQAAAFRTTRWGPSSAHAPPAPREAAGTRVRCSTTPLRAASASAARGAVSSSSSGATSFISGVLQKLVTMEYIGIALGAAMLALPAAWVLEWCAPANYANSCAKSGSHLALRASRMARSYLTQRSPPDACTCSRS